MSHFTTGQFLRRSLRHHARSHIAVAIGVVVAAMVIGGALIVGDSVRDSLKSLSLSRLGQVNHALVSHRFFREASVVALSQQPEFQKRFTVAAPGLVFQASLERRGAASGAEAASRTRSAGVTLYGTDERLWSLLMTAGTASPRAAGVVLSAGLAEQLRARVGDDVTVWVEIPATIPRDSLLGGKEEQATQEVRLKVEAVLPVSAGAGRFDLQPSQQFSKVAFVNLQALQKELNLEEVERSRRNPQAKPARVNALFVSARDPHDGQSESAVDASNRLTLALRDSVTLDDLHLRIVPNTERGYLSLESERMILEDTVAQSAETIADKLGLSSSPVLAYLVNLIRRDGDSSDKMFSKYSIVAGVPDPATLPKAFGPVTTVDGSPPPTLSANGVLLSEWLARDLGIRAEDFAADKTERPKVLVQFNLVKSKGDLQETARTFEVLGVLPLDGKLAGDRGMTPHVPGITDAETFNDWDQPFPMQLPVTDRDEDYWDRYRATPKAFFQLEDARRMWSNRYGSQTSLRLAPRDGLASVDANTLENLQRQFTRELLQSLKLESLGLGIQPVKWLNLRAASGTTDFAGLFIGFSFFMILSGLMLISLLVRLGIERRSGEIGLLSAIGFSSNRIGRLLFQEQFSVVLLGSLVGIVAAVGYAGLLIHGLRTWWVGAVGTTLLSLSVRPMTLMVSFAMTVAAASGSAWWGLRALRKLSPRELLSGQTEAVELDVDLARRSNRLRRIAARLLQACVVVIGLVIGFEMPTQEAFAGLSWSVVLFFVVGLSALTALICAFAAWLETDRALPVLGAGNAALFRLSLRNATRQRRRSILSLALIASATFLLVSVAAGRRNPAAEAPDWRSGNGGYQFVAESTTPLIHDLATPGGRNKLELRPDPDSREEVLLGVMRFASFRMRRGENASCLNLYQTRLPTILGVPEDILKSDRFKFVNTPNTKTGPWELLKTTQPDGEIPVFGDMNTLMYSLHKGVGDTLTVPDDEHPKATLRIAGMLDSSIFQGVLLMSEDNFMKLFPEQVGFQYFLIGKGHTPLEVEAFSDDDARKLSDLLETVLAPYGFDVEPIGDRLANFLAVQNTYLSTFQTLGGLGLLLGTFGLGTVMLRNVIERRAELALLRAVGFRPSAIRRLVLFENAFLLACGLVVGTCSALLAMLPHLLSTGADVPWMSGAGLLIGIFGVGLLAATGATAEAVRSPIVASLRGE